MIARAQKRSHTWRCPRQGALMAITEDNSLTSFLTWGHGCAKPQTLGGTFKRRDPPNLHAQLDFSDAGQSSIHIHNWIMDEGSFIAYWPGIQQQQLASRAARNPKAPEAEHRGTECGISPKHWGHLSRKWPALIFPYLYHNIFPCPIRSFIHQSSFPTLLLLPKTKESM